MSANEGSDAVSRRGFLYTATGAAVTAGAASGSVAAQEGNETESEGEGEEEGGGGGGAVEEVIVGPDGNTSFDPADLAVEPGTTVRWVWESDNHNVAPTSVPDDAEWEGHPDIVDAGTEYEHTFDVEGTYEYVCDPHANAGMEGAVTVEEGASQGGGGHEPSLPDSAMSLAIGTIAAMVSTLALAYFFIKYGGYEAEE